MEYGGVLQKRDQSSVDSNHNHHQALSLRQNTDTIPDFRMQTESGRRSHEIWRERTGTQSCHNSQGPKEPRRKHREAVHFLEGHVRDESPVKQDLILSKHRKSSRDAYYDVDRASSGNLHRRTSTHTRPMLPRHKGINEAYDSDGEDEAWDSHEHRHHGHKSVPPKAPRIPRLPTPDFDEMDYGEHYSKMFDFCACCDGSNICKTRPEGGESASVKMERQGMYHLLTDFILVASPDGTHYVAKSKK